MPKLKVARRIGVVMLGACAGFACNLDVNNTLHELSESFLLSTDLLVQFAKAADAANRAVMADTDEASVAFAKEAEEAKEAVQKSIDGLRPKLVSLGYSSESALLEELATRFAKYQELDRRILDLAVENSNLKAQRLAFGPIQEAANTFRDELQAVTRAAPSKDRWHVEALAANAVVTVREIQVLQAPHIADADDEVMTKMEKEMATSEASARSALAALAPLVPESSRPHFAAATASLDKFAALSAELVTLSRRNTNVRSLALSLDEKRALTTECEQSLHALHDALSKRGYAGAR